MLFDWGCRVAVRDWKSKKRLFLRDSSRMGLLKRRV